MNKSQTSYHKIKSLEVSGGFLDGVKIEFNDNLNCIIGGRGTGKTTVIEFIRYALNKMPNSDFSGSQYKIIERLVQNNLRNGQLKVTIETMNGLSYTIKKGISDEMLIFDENDKPVSISLDTGTLFDAEIYSQNEIEEIANDPYYQLNLIDKFIAGEIAEIERDIKITIRGLDQNASEILQLNKDINTLQEQLSELPAITEKLKKLKIEGSEGGKEIQRGSELKAIRSKEIQCLQDIETFLKQSITDIKNIKGHLIWQSNEYFEAEVFKGENKDIFLNIKSEYTKDINAINQKLAESIQTLQNFEKILQTNKRELENRHLIQEKKYNDLLQKYQKEKDKAKERDLLIKKQVNLLVKKKELDKKQADLKEKEGQRNKLLKTLSELRDKRYKLREKIVSDINDKLKPNIKVQLEQFGNRNKYSEILADSMKGSDLKYTRIIEKAVKIPPQQLVSYVQKSDIKRIMDLLELDNHQAIKFISQLENTKNIFDIETVELYDKPIIELKDGSDYKDSSQLSTGQKCTTILSILLLESKNPLLIDQPEDNLDNAFIYETVVKSLREIKGKRQLIFVTHNPNIPVLGDAECVFVMESSGRKAHITAQGSVDAIKEHIERLLEGGKEAFQKRKEKYGY